MPSASDPARATARVAMIMPVASDPDFVSKKSIAERLGMSRGLSVLTPQRGADANAFNLAEHLDEMAKCDLVIADLSHERPSCYYELGIAEGLRKHVVLIAKSRTTIHQTGESLVRFYDDIQGYERLLGEAMEFEASKRQ